MIITVDEYDMAGTVIRWYLANDSTDCGLAVQPDICVSREGVLIGTYLHRVEGLVLDHAKAVQAKLAEGREDPRQYHALATHVRTRWQELVSVTAPEKP